ncbi:MAG: class I adenylate-forming enzyme family protein [Lautropia sp.]
MLRRSAERFPDKPAIVAAGFRLSYRDLDLAANRLANALRFAVPAKGAKVAILSRNLPQYGIAFFGAARSGLILVNVSVQYSIAELAYVLGKSDAQILLFDAQFEDKVAAVLPTCPRIETVVAIGRSGLSHAVDFQAFLDAHPATDPDVDIAETDPFCMTYTGGTTGRPKGVLCSHRARATTALTVVVEEALDEQDVVAIVTPLFHVAALNIMFQPAVLVGATCVFVTPWSVDGFMQACDRERISAAFMVPTQANMLVTHPGFDATMLRSWRKLSFAGAPMPDWVQKALKEKLPHLALTQIYGQSEVGVLTSLRDWYLPAKLGAVGRQAFNVDVALFKTDGSMSAAGEPGEIASRGDNVMLEYYEEPEQTAAVFRLGDGWLLTGDIGVRDEDGFITLIDRAKDMLISGGENVYPKEIEDVIYELDAVAECAVFGIPDEKWGEVPAAYVMLKPGAALASDAVVARCQQRLAEFKRPRLVKIVTEFPKTPIGKIQKNLLREPFWKGKSKKI